MSTLSLAHRLAGAPKAATVGLPAKEAKSAEESTVARQVAAAPALASAPAPAAAFVLVLALALTFAGATTAWAQASPAAPPVAQPECIAPAKSGGGFDVTCRLVRTMFDDARLVASPVRITHLLGGIGAVAFHSIVATRPADPSALVAFSAGSLLNLAQGKFGPYTEKDVRWVASLGMDYGVVVVRKDARYQTLKDLVSALKANPNGVVFGAGGTLGSQDWLKSAKVSRAAGVDFKLMRFVAFEGGGEALTALTGGHVQVVAGDASEAAQLLAAGAPIRVLAVLASERLPGALATVPTAMEQGYDIRWPIVRGVYVGGKVSDADYRAWVESFRQLMARPTYPKQRAAAGLFPQTLVGDALTDYVRSTMADYRQLAGEYALRVPRAAPIP
ncbi:Bug family tripartite tricarboxylate transporter substrate binding protein [Pigmentiphaga litoralis]|uniref:Bug family tripartite tricarboxylate transporter substrate binding protein n=1 Tax=Pigmentiphaga litoralis TaxID=516702 RepID=UPI00167AEEDB|nr:tripartite tricarboxylate transporter substrate-binding protein [Pigmentiphaga litoralis]